MASVGNFSRRNFLAMALGGLIAPAALAGPGASLDTQSVCQRMVAEDKWRNQTLQGYSVRRRYRLTLGSSGKCSEMVVKADYTYPGHKSFEVLSQSNCGCLEERIFRQILNAEVQAARDDVRDSTRILPRNYDFEALGTADLDGRGAYILRMKPKRKQRFSVDGKIWVDMEDAAVTRLEGEVAPSSFWVHRVHMLQEYTRVGAYWLVSSTRNDASVRLVGEAHLNIDYFDYRLRPM